MKLIQKYDNEAAISREFDNVYRSLDDVKFKIVTSTPVVVATGTVTIDDGEAVLYSSGTFGKVFIRSGNNLFGLNLILQ